MATGMHIWLEILLIAIVCLLNPEKTCSQTIQRQLNRINTIITRMNTTLRRLEATHQECRGTAETLSESKSQLATECSSNVEHLQEKLTGISQNMDEIDRSAFSGTVLDIDKSDDAIDVLLKVPETIEDCIESFEGTPIGKLAAKLHCLQKLLWDLPPVVEFDQREDEERMKSFSNSRNIRLPKSTGGRVRREYRSLTLRQRRQFNAALELMYRDGTLAVFGRVHSRRDVESWAHGGPAFLLWHRAFLALFEEALREKNPSVTLPYWDCTIEDDAANPTNSLFWTEEYVGSGMGNLTTGPYRHWVSGDGPLVREFGLSSRLLSKKNIKDVLTRCHFDNITKNGGFHNPNYTIESHHDGVHAWVGGTMGFIPTAAYDPIFYLHHAFVDYIWEKFRKRQRDCGVDPTSDYPAFVFNSRHRLERQMVGMEFFNNKDGLADWWTGGDEPWYTYAEPPACPLCDSSDGLLCDVVKQTCIPKRRIEVPPFPVMTTQTPFTSSSSSTAFFASSASRFVASSQSRPPPRRGAFFIPEAEIKTRIPIEETVIPAVIAHDILAKSSIVRKNWGTPFRGASNDPRTLFTAFADALKRDFERARGF